MSKHHANIPGGMRHWQGLRRATFERDGYRCVRCGKAGALECHHRIHMDDGGSNDLDNLETLCRDCHIRHHRREVISPERKAWAAFLDELR